MSSPFSGATLKAKKKNETRTHADVILGCIEVDYNENTGVSIEPCAKIVGVIEAKMNSNVSQATTNAPDYNQISRTVSCLAYNAPADCRIFVWDVAPECKLKKNDIAGREYKDSIRRQINNRLKRNKQRNNQ